MTVKPLHDRVLIKVTEEETKTASGLILPDSSKDKPTIGEVIAVGTGYKLADGSIRALDVKAGDKVLFDKWSGNGAEVKIDNQEFLMLKEEKILGILQ
jgi:chaperonin GroES